MLDITLRQCQVRQNILPGLRHISCPHLTDRVLLPSFGLHSGCGYWSLTPDLKFIFKDVVYKMF